VDEMTLLGCFMLMVHRQKVNRLWITSVIHLYILDEVRVMAQTRKVTRLRKTEKTQHTGTSAPTMAITDAGASSLLLSCTFSLYFLFTRPFLRFS
jgi:hypothetical protein